MITAHAFAFGLFDVVSVGSTSLLAPGLCGLFAAYLHGGTVVGSLQPVRRGANIYAERNHWPSFARLPAHAPGSDVQPPKLPDPHDSKEVNNQLSENFRGIRAVLARGYFALHLYTAQRCTSHCTSATAT
eukprot:251533-Amphidinium_carterae.1